MKTRSHTLTLTFPLLALSCFVPFAPAQDTTRSDRDATTQTAGRNKAMIQTDLTQGVYLASIDAEERSLRRYAGQTLMNTEGGELGGIRDFIVHPGSSRIRYIVVSSGGVLGGIGNSLRLVPFEFAKWDADAKRFKVDILQTRWLQLPPVSDQDYVADRFTITAAQHQAIVDGFGSGNAAASRAGTAGERDAFAGLMRASTLRGKAVQASGRKVGDIENIIVDVDRGAVAAMIDASGDFTGTSAKYLVPLSRLTFTSPQDDPISTTLTRADFDRARPSDFGMAGRMASSESGASTADEPTLTPTGRTDTQATSNDALHASAEGVRRAFKNDPALEEENVQVTTENGKIVLRGSVRSQLIKDKLETAARRAVPAGSIDSRITVVNR